MKMGKDIQMWCRRNEGINSSVRNHLSTLLIFLFLCSPYTSYSQCDVRLTLGVDSLSASESIACIPLYSTEIMGVTSFSLGLTYDANHLSYQSVTMLDGSAIDVKTSTGNLTISWKGSALNVAQDQQLLEICFDVGIHEQEGYDIAISGEGLPIGNQISTEGGAKTLCSNTGRIETICSIRQFAIHKEFRLNNKDRCRSNDTTTLGYPYQLHDLLDFPITVTKYRNGVFDEERVYASTDPSEDFPQLTVYHGSYQVFVSNAQGCIDSASFEVLRVVPNFIDNVTGFGGHEITHTCQGINDGAILEKGFWIPGDSGTWSNGVVESFLENAWEKFEITDLAPGVYTLMRQTPGEGHCIATATYEVLDIPNYQVNYNTRFVSCDGADGAIWIDSAPPGNYKYKWEGRADTTGTIDNLSPGTYQVTITNPEGCEVERTIDLPMTSYIALEWESEVTYPDCRPETKASRSVSLSGSNLSGVDFIWSSGETSNGNSATATHLDSGRQWVHASTSTCVSDTIFFEVPTPTILELSIDSTNSNLAVCDGEQGVTTLLSSITDVTYSENSNPLTGNSFDLTIGAHTITATTADGGCSQDIVVNISSNSSYYELQNQVAQELCLGQEDSSAINLLSGPDIASILINQVTVDPADPVSFDIGANLLRINNVEGCTWDTTITITEKILDISVPPDLTVTQGSDITITTDHDDSEPLLYTWMATNPWNCIVTDCRSIDYNPVESETIYLDVTNEIGCIYEDSIRITVIDTMTIDTMGIIDTIPDQDALFYIPNIVSANSITNNSFCIHYVEGAMAIEQFNLYDRWGNLIENTPTPSQGRTCLLENISLSKYNPGVYIYSIDILLPDGRRRKISGDVTIIN